MNKLLKYWPNVWFKVSMSDRLDFKRSVIFRKSNIPFEGASQKYGSAWIAIFIEQEKIFIVIDNKKIPLVDIELCTNLLISNSVRNFSIQLKNGDSKKIQYKRKLSKLEIFIDPTLDNIDEMHADLLLWISEVFSEKSIEAAFLRGISKKSEI